jgi:hypothetical protein
MKLGVCGMAVHDYSDGIQFTRIIKDKKFVDDGNPLPANIRYLPR